MSRRLAATLPREVRFLCPIPYIMSANRFDLEQQIMSVWGIVEDLELLSEGFSNGMSEDQQLNLVIGLKELYSLKCERLFNTYTRLVQDKKL